MSKRKEPMMTRNTALQSVINVATGRCESEEYYLSDITADTSDADCAAIAQQHDIDISCPLHIRHLRRAIRLLENELRKDELR